ncbi:hypothetical protein SUGI_0680670 [Cryptomeria japonica]|nr:hypothetical protein SUGI_0680670 [Cryptomeria japonica]
MEMEIGVWRNLPDEIALNVIARLLPRRSLVRLRSVWKEWNEMLSSYDAMQTMYPKIHLSSPSAFLFQCYVRKTGRIHTWVLEGSGEFYLASDDSYRVEIACNNMFCFLVRDYTYCICNEESRVTWTRIPHENERFYGHAFDFCTEHFVMVKGCYQDSINVYDSSSNSWNDCKFSLGDSDEFWPSGKGVYHRGRFYWLDHGSCSGGVVELNVSERCWTKISAPEDAVYRYSEYTYRYFRAAIIDTNDSIASGYWELVGSDIGELILIDKEWRSVWKLENGEESIRSKRWCRVDICLPKSCRLISVNNSGWILTYGQEGIHVYDGSRRLVRIFSMNELDPKLRKGLIIGGEENYSIVPFECTYIWWPW